MEGWDRWGDRWRVFTYSHFVINQLQANNTWVYLQVAVITISERNHTTKMYFGFLKRVYIGSVVGVFLGWGGECVEHALVHLSPDEVFSKQWCLSPFQVLWRSGANMMRRLLLTKNSRSEVWGHHGVGNMFCVLCPSLSRNCLFKDNIILYVHLSNNWQLNNTLERTNNLFTLSTENISSSVNGL